MRKANIFLTFVLVLVFCLGLSKEGMPQRNELNEQAKLRQEIQLLNLLSGLFLTDEQMEFLIREGKEVQRTREAHKRKVEQYSEAQTQSLQELKGELEEYDVDGEVPPDLAREIHQSNMQLRKLKAEYTEELENIITEVKNNLTSTQVHIVEEFVPCLVPPKGPARFGQSEEGAKGTKQLERIRAISNSEYELRKNALADRAINVANLYKKNGEEIDEAALRNKVISIFDEARALSEIDFGWKKEELAKEIKECVFPKYEKGDIDRRIERFLLSPVMVSLLEKELAESEDVSSN